LDRDRQAGYERSGSTQRVGEITEPGRHWVFVTLERLWLLEYAELMTICLLALMSFDVEENKMTLIFVTRYIGWYSIY
jgi:hypothetical protein